MSLSCEVRERQRECNAAFVAGTEGAGTIASPDNNGMMNESSALAYILNYSLSRFF